MARDRALKAMSLRRARCCRPPSGTSQSVARCTRSHKSKWPSLAAVKAMNLTAKLCQSLALIPLRTLKFNKCQRLLWLMPARHKTLTDKRLQSLLPRTCPRRRRRTSVRALTSQERGRLQPDWNCYQSRLRRPSGRTWPCADKIRVRTSRLGVSILKLTGLLIMFSQINWRLRKTPTPCQKASTGSIRVTRWEPMIFRTRRRSSNATGPLTR